MVTEIHLDKPFLQYSYLSKNYLGIGDFCLPFQPAYGFGHANESGARGLYNIRSIVNTIKMIMVGENRICPDNISHAIGSQWIVFQPEINDYYFFLLKHNLKTSMPKVHSFLI